MEAFNQIYTVYLQCINIIVRDDINDTIVFRETVQIYFNTANQKNIFHSLTLL